MKTQKVITIISIILLIVIISVASFFGIYKKEEYKVSSVVPNYILGVNFADSRIVNFKVDRTTETTTIYDKDGNEVTEKQEGVEYTEENGYKTVTNKENSDEILTVDNYKNCKKILTDRLAILGADEYNVKQNIETGDIQIEMTQDDNTDKLIATLMQKGKFELTDTQTNEVLLNNSNIDNVKVVYGQADTGTTVYLQIKFNKEGKDKLEEISKIYVETTNQITNEKGEIENKTEKKEVSILFDGEVYRKTYFGETITDGTLNVAIGSGKDADTLQQYAKSASEIGAILNTGVMPIKYSVTSYTVTPAISSAEFNIAGYIAITLLLLMFIYLIIKLKTKGLLAIFLNIGFISLFLLVLRYTNIKITLEGVVGIIISILLNYMYIYKIFKNSKMNFIKETTAKFALKLIPIYIIAIVFTFNNIANISSLGMTLVWGIIIIYLYNLTLTQLTIKTIENK